MNRILAGIAFGLAACAAPLCGASVVLLDHFTADTLNPLGNGQVLGDGDWASSVGGAYANLAGNAPMLRTNAIGGHSTVYFDGTDALRIHDGAMAVSTPHARDDFTIVAVYRTNAGMGSTGGWWTNTSIVDSEEAGHVNDWGLNISATGQLVAGLGRSPSNSTSLYSTTGGHFQDGLAHVAVYTRSGATMELYVDGDLVGTSTTASTDARNAVDYFFSRNHTTGGGYRLTGDLAEVQLYGGAMPGADVLSLSGELLAKYAGSAYQQAVLAANPLHYYRLGDLAATGGVAYDELGTNHGTITGAPLPNQAGALGGDANTAMAFNGSTDWIRVNNTLPASFSLEAWIKTDVASRTGSHSYQGDGLIWSDVPGGANDFVLALLGNKLSFYQGDINRTINGTSDLTDGEWHHVVVTREAGNAADGLKLYVNGLLEASGQAGANTLNAQTYIAFGGNVIDNRYFTGLMDEIALYNGVLLPSQVYQHWAAGVPEPGTWLMLLSGLAGWALPRRRRTLRAIP